jgi:hypothetical protein
LELPPKYLPRLLTMSDPRHPGDGGAAPISARGRDA